MPSPQIEVSLKSISQSLRKPSGMVLSVVRRAHQGRNFLRSRQERPTHFAVYAFALLGALPPGIVFLGWLLTPADVHRLFLTLPDMVPWTAVMLLSICAALIGSVEPRLRPFALIPVALVIAVSSTMLTEYFCRFHFRIDTLLFRDAVSANPLNQYPGRTSPQSCTALLALAFAVILHRLSYHVNYRIRHYLFQLLASAALMVSVLAGFGFLYSITHLFGLSPYVGVSIQTAASIFLLSIATLNLEATGGVIFALMQENSAGFFMRNFVVGGICAPFFVAGAIRWAILYQGLNSDYGNAAFVFFTVFSLLALAIFTARSLQKVESQKIRIEMKQLELSEANEAGQLKDKFLANISHEVRTPLMAILGYLSCLHEETISKEERHKFVERAEISAKGLLRVLDDVLNVSNMKTDQIEVKATDFNPRTLVDEVMAAHAFKAASGKVALITDVKSTVPPELHADAGHIRQIAMNLLSNAVKFTEVGQIQLVVNYEPSLAANRGQLTIAVTDTGIGISADDQLKLFQAFFKVDDSMTRKFGGSGLSLAISQRLAHLMSGSLSVHSNDIVQGSSFVLQIPCEIPTKALVAVSKKPLDGMRVLLVEDNADNQFLMTRFLKGAGAQVELAENGEVGVKMGLAQAYAVILMDIQMPVMGGLEATRLLRASGCTQPIVALSAHATKEHGERSIAAGCNAHLGKPISKDELTSSILSVLPLS